MQRNRPPQDPAAVERLKSLNEALSEIESVVPDKANSEQLARWKQIAPEAAAIIRENKHMREGVPAKHGRRDGESYLRDVLLRTLALIDKDRGLTVPQAVNRADYIEAKAQGREGGTGAIADIVLAEDPAQDPEDEDSSPKKHQDAAKKFRAAKRASRDLLARDLSDTDAINKVLEYIPRDPYWELVQGSVSLADKHIKALRVLCADIKRGRYNKRKVVRLEREAKKSLAKGLAELVNRALSSAKEGMPTYLIHWLVQYPLEHGFNVRLSHPATGETRVVLRGRFGRVIHAIPYRRNANGSLTLQNDHIVMPTPKYRGRGYLDPDRRTRRRSRLR